MAPFPRRDNKVNTNNPVNPPGYIRVNKSSLTGGILSAVEFGELAIKASHALAIKTQEEIRGDLNPPIICMLDYPGYLNLVALYIAIYRSYAIILLKVLDDDLSRMEEGIVSEMSSLPGFDGENIDRDFIEYCYTNSNKYSEAILRDFEIASMVNLAPFSDDQSALSNTYLAEIDCLWNTPDKSISENDRNKIAFHITRTPTIYYNEFQERGYEYFKGEYVKV